MEGLTWLLALALGLAGALYVYWQQVEAARKKVEAAELQARKEALAREQLAVKKSKSKPKKVDITAELKKKKQAQESEDPSKEHASFLHALKGHKFALTAAAYSPNGRFIATASTDRTIRLHLRESLGDKNARTHQINIEYDHVTAMTFSSDGRLLVVATEGGMVKLYQKLKVKPELVAEFPVAHKADVHSIIMNDIGQWATIVTCAGEADTDVKFWNLRGDLLQVVNTNQVTNYHCVASKDNRYIAVAAYTPEVKIFEISREKNGTFKKVNKIMTLHGHRTGVVDLAFNGSESKLVDRIATISKDASVRLWDINVRYTVQEDPKVVSTFTASEQRAFQGVDYAPDGKVLAMVRDKDVVFVSAADNKEFFVIENALEEPVKRATFSPDGSEILVVGARSKHAKIYKSPSL